MTQSASGTTIFNFQIGARIFCFHCYRPLCQSYNGSATLDVWKKTEALQDDKLTEAKFNATAVLRMVTVLGDVETWMGAERCGYKPNLTVPSQTTKLNGARQGRK